MYICGPTAASDAPDNNHAAFRECADRLRALGFEPIDPSELGAGELTYAQYMRADIAAVLTADALAVLPGWDAGVGSRLEVAIAVAIGIPVMSLALQVVYPATAGRDVLRGLLA